MCNFGFQPEALNRAFLDIFEELLFCRIFFHAKLPPGTAKTVFANPKGPPFGFSKTVFAVRGGNFARKKILQNQKFLKYVQECPVKCLWLKSKIAHLSDPPNEGQSTTIFLRSTWLLVVLAVVGLLGVTCQAQSY